MIYDTLLWSLQFKSSLHLRLAIGDTILKFQHKYCSFHLKTAFNSILVELVVLNNLQFKTMFFLVELVVLNHLQFKTTFFLVELVVLNHLQLRSHFLTELVVLKWRHHCTVSVFMMMALRVSSGQDL